MMELGEETKKKNGTKDVALENMKDVTFSEIQKREGKLDTNIERGKQSLSCFIQMDSIFSVWYKAKSLNKRGE